MLSVKDFNPFYHTEVGQYQQHEFKLELLPEADKSLEEMVEELPSEIEVFSFPFDDDLFIPIKVREHQMPSEEVVSKEIASTGRFHFIVGCFSDRQNAENLVIKLKSIGLSAIIAGEVNGLTRVSAGRVNSETELQELMNKVTSLGYSGWVLKN
jgi:cell division protein FtsN